MKKSHTQYPVLWHDSKIRAQIQQVQKMIQLKEVKRNNNDAAARLKEQERML